MNAVSNIEYPGIGTALDERIDNLTQAEADRLNAIEDMEERLHAAGFQTASVADFLGLSPEEEELIKVRLSLVRAFASPAETFAPFKA